MNVETIDRKEVNTNYIRFTRAEKLLFSFWGCVILSCSIVVVLLENKMF